MLRPSRRRSTLIGRTSPVEDCDGTRGRLFHKRDMADPDGASRAARRHSPATVGALSGGLLPLMFQPSAFVPRRGLALRKNSKNVLTDCFEKCRNKKWPARSIITPNN